MTTHTYNTIMAAKGRFDKLIGVHIDDGEGYTPYEAVKQYFCEYYDSSLEAYTKGVMTGMMLDILADYLDTCNNIEEFIRNCWKDVIDFEKLSVGESLCIAFSLVQVKTGDTYINGFQDILKDGTD